MGGVADVLLAHHIGDPRGLGFEMKALDAHGRKLGQIEPREDVQHHQHGDARAVWRALPHVMPFIDGADRNGGLGGVAGEIVRRVQTADAAQSVDHVIGDRPLVKGVTPVFRNRPQRLSEFGLFDDVSGHRRLTARQQITLGVGAFLQFFELVLPIERDTRTDNVAPFRGLDRRLQQGIQSQLAVVAQNGRPCVHRTGNRNGVRRGQRDRTHAAFEIPGWLGRLGRTARAVIGHYLAVASWLQQRETIPADPRGLRLNDG